MKIEELNTATRYLALMRRSGAALDKGDIETAMRLHKEAVSLRESYLAVRELIEAINARVRR